MTPDRYLAGRHAVVTGGGRGIGAAIATEMARLGASVTIMGRSRPHLEQQASVLEATLGVRALAVPCNVADERQVVHAFRAAREALGEVHVLVNNAGEAAGASFTETTRELWDRLLAVNLTAQFLCADSYAIRNGDGVLVHAAGGGVGQLLTQLARARGAQVIALASSNEKRAAALQAGASIAIDSGDGWVERVRAALPDGADVVYDSIGRTLPDSLALARTGGTVVFYGMAAGDPDPVDPRMLMDRSLTLVGGDLWNVLTSAQARQSRADKLFASIIDGDLKVPIAARIPLREGARAHALLEGRGVTGKLLLIP